MEWNSARKLVWMLDKRLPGDCVNKSDCLGVLSIPEKVFPINEDNNQEEIPYYDIIELWTFLTTKVYLNLLTKIPLYKRISSYNFLFCFCFGFVVFHIVETYWNLPACKWKLVLHRDPFCSNSKGNRSFTLVCFFEKNKKELIWHSPSEKPENLTWRRQFVKMLLSTLHVSTLPYNNSQQCLVFR